MTLITSIGVTGLILVFLSFLVQNWRWLYLFNGLGSFLLALYAFLQGNWIFTVLESGIVFFLLLQLYKELHTPEIEIQIEVGGEDD